MWTCVTSKELLRSEDWEGQGSISPKSQRASHPPLGPFPWVLLLQPLENKIPHFTSATRWSSARSVFSHSNQSPGRQQHNVQKGKRLELWNLQGRHQDPDDVVYGVLFLKIWHTYIERCCGKITGFTPTPLLFIALDGTKFISEHSHKGKRLWNN